MATALPEVLQAGVEQQHRQQVGTSATIPLSNKWAAIAASMQRAYKRPFVALICALTPDFKSAFASATLPATTSSMNRVTPSLSQGMHRLSKLSATSASCAPMTPKIAPEAPTIACSQGRHLSMSKRLVVVAKVSYAQMPHTQPETLCKPSTARGLAGKSVDKSIFSTGICLRRAVQLVSFP